MKFVIYEFTQVYALMNVVLEIWRKLIFRKIFLYEPKTIDKEDLQWVYLLILVWTL